MTTPILITPGAEPITQAEIDSWVKDPAPEDRALLDALVTAARQWMESAMDRQLISATWEIRMPYFPPWVEFPYPPLQSVVSVKYDDVNGDEQTLATDTYDVVTTETPGYLALAYGKYWPPVDINPEAVRIRFVAGYGNASDVPELAKTAIKMLALFWYENRSNTGDIPAGVKAIAITAGAYRF